MGRLSRREPRAVERIYDGGVADERVLDHLALRGYDSEQPHESTHYLYFAVERCAEDVARVLRADGWTTSICQSEGAWLLVGTHVSPLTSELVRDNRRRLEALSAEHGGLYDGWEAPL